MIFVKDSLSDVKDSLSDVNKIQVNESGMHEDLELSKFLNQFQDVFIDNIPGELPSKQGDDDHAIELIPGSSPPNKPLYRVSQAQQEEIMGQVYELEEKGMVRPSSSPFCSSVLLVHKKDGTYRKNRMDEYPILNKFCYTAEELHEEYGLSLEGKVAKDLSGYDLPDDQWLTVFQHQYQKNAKLSFLDAMLLRSAMLLKKTARDKTAWARFGESVLNMCSSKLGGLDKKVENWKRANGAFHGGLLGSNKKRHYTQGASNMCDTEEDKVLQFETVAVDYISDSHCSRSFDKLYVEFEQVKEEYTDNHAADKHSKAGHIFYEEMEGGGKCCDVEMHKATTRSFQGMSNEVQPDKLDEDKDTTTGAHEGVNDRREEPDHEKVEVGDENFLSENKDGDKDPIIEDPKVDTGGNNVSKEEDPKVDTGVSKEPLEECLPTDEEVHKAQFLGDKDPIGVDVNEHTQGLKAWWLDEPTVIECNHPEDILASKGRLIILDVNGVVLKSWSRLPKDEWEL
ncbi:hypothetical protein L7F22_058310 [Adiantum nelumboides]|nr:hypothetical protein [Adiantum nelumboides]